MMKSNRLGVAIAGIVLLVPGMWGQASRPSDAATEIDSVVARIQTKLRADQKSAEQLAPELAAFDELLTKYATGDRAAIGKILQLEYSLYSDVIRDAAKTAEFRKLLTTKYRDELGGTKLGQQLVAEEIREKAKAAQTALVGQPAPELNFIWATRPDLKKLSDLKGKVVVLDFWATWCGPCRATFPQIRELTAHYKDANVVVIGVTSIQGYVSGLQPARIDTRGDAEKEFQLTSEFIKANDMTWTVGFTDERVFNPAYAVLGIPHMAIIAPDGTVRQNGLHPGMPHAEKVAMIDAILKEFNSGTAKASIQQ